MNKLYYLLLLLFFPFYTWATNNPAYSIFNISPELLENAKAVVRQEVIEFEVLSPEVAKEHIKVVATRFKTSAPFEELQVHYDMYSKVGKITAAIYDANGKLIRKIGKKEILDYSAVSGGTIYADSRIKYIDFSYGQYPYTIEYEYIKTYKGIRTYPSWYIQDYATAVENSSYTLSIPSQLNFNYKVYNIDLEVVTSAADSKNIYKWQAKNLPAIEKEIYHPSASEMLPIVLFAPDKFIVDGYQGSMTTWKDFGNFMLKLNKGRSVLSEHMIAEIKKMTANATSDKEKINILYQYLQDNMRYVSVQLGIGGWQTFDAAYVEKNKFGDCKALTYYMKAMLREVGIDAYPALVKAGKEKDFQVAEDFTYPLFNHVILNVPSQGYWLECTSADAPANYLGTFTDNRNVLLITNEGGVFSKTPELTPEDNRTENVSTLKITNKGGANIKNQTIFTGTQHEYYRYLENNASKEDIKKYFSHIVDLPSFFLNNYNLKSAKDEPTTQMKYEIEVPRYGSKAGKRLFLPLNVINPFTNVPDKNDSRKYGIQIDRGYIENDIFTFELPTGTSVESIPETDKTITSDFGTYQVKVEQQEGKLIYQRTLKILPVKVPVERYDELRDFYKEIAKLDKMKVVLLQERA